MILGFKEFFDAKKTQPTNFREKILAGVFKTWETGAKVIDEKDQVIKLGVIDQPSSSKPEPYTNITPKPKLHTFRVDQFNRWKADMSIQMVYRGPKYSIKDHFNKGITELEKCKSTQKVEIKWITYTVDKVNQSWPRKELNKVMYFPVVWVDKRLLAFEEICILAVNDGFEDIHHFFRWFNNDWTGKCLHWTDLRY